MIVVRVELWPSGDESSKRELGVAHIANTGGTHEIGEYAVTLFKSREYATKAGVWKAGKVKGFARLRLGPWDLLYRALQATVGTRQ